MKIRHKTQLRVRAQSGAIHPYALLIAMGVVLVIGIIVYLLYPRQEGEAPPGPPPEPPATAETRGDNAREVIAELRSGSGNIDYEQAYVRAQEFHQAGRVADAQLLYFFAARGNHGQAAFDLATMYDPTRYSSEISLMDHPDPYQAYKWYKQAQADGVDEAIERLAALRSWAEEAASAGDTTAEQLLVQWK